MNRYRNRTTLLSACLLALVACTSYQQQDTATPGPTLPADAFVADAAPERPDRREAKFPAGSPVPPGQPALSAPARRLDQARPSTLPAQSSLPAPLPRRLERDRENYAHFDDNPLHRVLDDPVSTFSIDVDTGAYANVRRFLHGGRLPPHDAVRVEELINYFSYRYEPPADAAMPFSITTEIGPSPWNGATRLLHVGLQGYRVPRRELPPANLVFLIDVSGSMRAPNKLALLKPAMKLLARQMSARDRIAIAVYAGASGTVLAPTRGDRYARIEAAIDGLHAGGSTNGAAGLGLAYQLAERSLDADGINRVVLATDGDFNVGTTDVQQLKELVAAKRRSGIALTTLGFGAGNYNDALMEQIADVGNGNYAYIDNLNEARKVLVDELSSTLMTIAKDVKIQIEFNPAVVSEYRLIGYVNRRLRGEDFANDKVDAGEIGAGHSVTALYEIALHGSGGERLPPLRYQPRVEPATAPRGETELGIVRLRYKAPHGSVSRLIERPVQIVEMRDTLAQTTDRYRFSAAVAAFGEALRGGRYLGEFDLRAVQALARTARGSDETGYRAEFLQLVGLALALHDGVAQAGH